MIERGEDFRLTLEACESFSIPGHRRGQDFDCNATFQVGVGGLVDLAHPTRADLGEDFIWAEAGTGSEEHRWRKYMGAALVGSGSVLLNGDLAIDAKSSHRSPQTDFY